MDCPECGGRNTLSLTHDERGLVWHCFKADCEVHGAKGTRLTTDSFSSLVAKEPVYQNPVTMERPPHWRDKLPFQMIAYLKENNCWHAYGNHKHRFAYDVKQNRAVFLINRGSLVDAAGRALDNRLPKWHRYGTSHEPFIMCPGVDVTGEYRTAVVVEDCASACAVYSFYTGVAILGTSILPAHIRALQRYKKVIVALDKDASEKGIDIAHKLSTVGIPSEVVFLEEDLKRNPRQIL